MPVYTDVFRNITVSPADRLYYASQATFKVKFILCVFMFGYSVYDHIRGVFIGEMSSIYDVYLRLGAYKSWACALGRAAFWQKILFANLGNTVWENRSFVFLFKMELWAALKGDVMEYRHMLHSWSLVKPRGLGAFAVCHRNTRDRSIIQTINQ